jgi:hypothetical protein
MDGLLTHWTPPSPSPRPVKTSFYLDMALLDRAKVEAAKDKLSLRGWFTALIAAEFQRRDATGKSGRRASR